MALAAGEKLGPYEILGPIGAGGMGEVYRARDTRLNRSVALKTLPPSRMDNPEHRRRFLQEAKSASALNHPNIVTIYDIGNDRGIDYLAMELVPGKPLGQLIPQGGMPQADLLRYAVQIADALAKAHAAGITHRDLKPANVMVTPEGVAKVLDFGLAKFHSPSGSAADSITTETLGAVTEEGTVIGTAAYMSPEQAEGKKLDSRSDIFSFGAILYEMACGRRAFRGDSSLSVMAAVLRDEPEPLQSLRPDLSPGLERLITRCMRKDLARRAHSMADLRVAFEELREETVPPKNVAVPRRLSRRFTLVIAASLLAVLAIAAYFTWRANTLRSSAVLGLQPVPFTSYPGSENQPNFSPDGNQVVFAWDGEQADNSDIYVKLIGSGTPLRLTTDPRPDVGPKWSPNGSNIAFVRLLSDDTFEVLLVPPLGGPERKVGQFYTSQFYNVPMASLCWTPDSRYLLVAGSLVKNQSNRILRVAVDSGEVATLAATDEVSSGYTQPVMSWDGATLAAVHARDTGSIELLSLSKTLELSAVRKLPLPNMDVRYVAWTADDRDLVLGLVLNNPVPLYRMSASGGPPRPLLWTGPGSYQPATSRQGRRLAFGRAYVDSNLWQLSLDGKKRGPPSLQKLASSTFREVAPQYSPDGKRLTFHSNRGGSVQIWTSDADGSHAVQLTSMDAFAVTGTPRWSPDGQYISFDSNAGGNYQIYVVKADGGLPRALTSGSSYNFVTTWSGDGRYIYFSSKRTGRSEIWRVPFVGGDAEQITRTGAECPTVSRDGRWLYYTKGDGAQGVWRTPIETAAETRLTGPINRYNFAPAADGLYFIPTADSAGMNSIRFVNFTTGATDEVLRIEKPVDLGLAVSPDGRNLLYSQVDYSGRDLMLVEGFR